MIPLKASRGKSCYVMWGPKKPILCIGTGAGRSVGSLDRRSVALMSKMQDCIQGFKLIWEEDRQVIQSYCCEHDESRRGTEALKDIFITAHILGESYPGGTEKCYDGLVFKERWYRIIKLLPCVKW